MNEEKRTEIGTLGEFGLIDRLTKNIRPNNPSTLKGIGDDAAVIQAQAGSVQVLTTDLLVEGIHFDLMYVPLKHLGYKAIAVNLSDVYAMNAYPKQVTVSLAISNRFSVEALEELYEGINAACDKYGVDFVGGDTTSSLSGLMISVTAIGECERSQLTYRHTANEGDIICVTGDLGAAFLGLQLMEREKQLFIEEPALQPDLENQKYLVGRQLKPEPRKDIIDVFRSLQIQPNSMIDISDGLSSDIMHICKKSDVGCVLTEETIPVHKETYDMALKFNMDPINAALSGGEDYELLFTINPADEAKLRDVTGITIIGSIVPKAEGMKLKTRGNNFYDLVAMGWDGLKKEE